MKPIAELFYCPFCAEEDLYPADERDAWRCTTCQRTFSVALISVGTCAHRRAKFGGAGFPRVAGDER